MAQLWVQIAGDNGMAEWAILELASQAYHLCGDPARPARICRRASGGADGAAEGEPILTKAKGRVEGPWVLLTHPEEDLAVNGQPLRLGIRVLDDRDEIRIGNWPPLFFTSERLPRVETFPGGDPPVLCARCRQPVSGAAVRCPECALWYHQDPAVELECFSYAETCAGCGGPTRLGEGYRWTPDGR